MSFSQEIIGWYQEHKRDLPWRHTRDPYVIWLSEIILQQTRVDQGLPYFHRFLEAFEDVKSFAEAQEDTILRYWQGLGYYSRARNMHQAAKMVMEEFGGQFPTRYADLIRLKGVGEYTAAAIASFSSGEAVAVVDGNVFRVLARYFGVDTPINSTQGKKVFQALADELLDREHPDTYNQAMMEFGALQCKPKSPACAACVLREGCYALKHDQVDALPVKLKAKASRKRYFNYLLMQQEDRVLINKRGGGDIWEGLFELPLVETTGPVSDENPEGFAEHIRTRFGERAAWRPLGPTVKHVLSHQTIYADFYLIEHGENLFEEKTNWDYVELKELNNLAKPKLIVAFLEGEGLLG